MMSEERIHLLSERTFLQEMVDTAPEEAWISRMGHESRLREIEARLAELPEDEPDPVRCVLSFEGKAAVTGRGVSAVFLGKVISEFAGLVTAIASSLRGVRGEEDIPPGSHHDQILVSGVEGNQCGVMFEAAEPPQPADGSSPVEMALARMQLLLRGFIGDDDLLADAISQIPRNMLDRVQEFLRFLVDQDTVLAMEYRDRYIAFDSIAQIQQGLSRLSDGSLHESQVELQGQFVGVLPESRTFEFWLADGRQVVSGKISPGLDQVETLNLHLDVPVRVIVSQTQVGNSKPHYMLDVMPSWQELPSAQETFAIET